jgi:hypothetical protein
MDILRLDPVINPRHLVFLVHLQPFLFLTLPPALVAAEQRNICSNTMDNKYWRCRAQQYFLVVRRYYQIIFRCSAPANIVVACIYNYCGALHLANISSNDLQIFWVLCTYKYFECLAPLYSCNWLFFIELVLGLSCTF